MSVSTLMPIDVASNVSTQSTSPRFPSRRPDDMSELSTERTARDAGALQPQAVAGTSAPLEWRSELLQGLDALRQANPLYWKLNTQILSQERRRRGLGGPQIPGGVPIHGHRHAMVVGEAQARGTRADEAT